MGVGDFLENAQEGEHYAVDGDHGEQPLDGDAAGDADPEGADQQPGGGVDREHPPRVHILVGGVHARREPGNTLNGVEPPKTVMGDENPGWVERLREDVAEQEKPQPEDREADELRPHDEPEITLRREFAAITAIDDRKREGDDRQAETDELAPHLHGAERPGREAKERADDDQQSVFERVQDGGGANFSAKSLQGVGLGWRLGAGGSGRHGACACWAAVKGWGEG